MGVCFFLFYFHNFDVFLETFLLFLSWTWNLKTWNVKLATGELELEHGYLDHCREGGPARPKLDHFLGEILLSWILESWYLMKGLSWLREKMRMAPAPKLLGEVKPALSWYMVWLQLTSLIYGWHEGWSTVEMRWRQLLDNEDSSVRVTSTAVLKYHWSHW